MTLRHSLLAAAVLAIAAGQAQATTTNLAVTGSIVPTACIIALSNNGVVDIGQIDITKLSAVAENLLPSHTVDVTIGCSTATQIATVVTEERAGSATQTGNAYFGLGRTSSSAQIGHYTVRADSGKADSVDTPVIGAADVTTWTSPGGGVPVEHGAGNKYTAVGATATGPASARDVQWTLHITPTIAPTGSLALTGPEDVDGQMTLTLVYL
jgi:type 1 fimbria pilin